MKVQIVDTPHGLSYLEYAWNNLFTRCDHPSLYSSYDYNRIAWKHFSNTNDSLFILVLYDDSEIKAIAPFRISVKKHRFITTRTIEFIAAWEGDRPSIIAPGCEEAAWDSICFFLSSEYLKWDILNIVEQSRDSALRNGAAFYHDKGCFCEISHDSTSYYVDLTGSWDSYLTTVGPDIKKSWRRRLRRLQELPGGLSVEMISQPKRITEALDRFVALEKLSWKGEARIGIHGNLSCRLFYEEFTHLLGEKEQTIFLFLKAGDTDVAGSLAFEYRDVIYSRHAAYNPEYAKYSPGICLLIYELQQLFSKGFKEYDMMGMHPNAGIPKYKAEWASGTLETAQLLVFNKKLKLLPMIWGKRIKGLLRRPRSYPE